MHHALHILDSPDVVHDVDASNVIDGSSCEYAVTRQWHAWPLDLLYLLRMNTQPSA